MEFLTDSIFAASIKEGVTVVDFFADWCQPCKMLAPTFEKAAKTFEGKAEFRKIDVETNPLVTSIYKIEALPTIAIFKAGEIVERHKGLITQKQLEDLVNKHLAT